MAKKAISIHKITDGYRPIVNFVCYYDDGSANQISINIAHFMELFGKNEDWREESGELTRDVLYRFGIQEKEFNNIKYNKNMAVFL